MRVYGRAQRDAWHSLLLGKAYMQKYCILGKRGRLFLKKMCVLAG